MITTSDQPKPREEDIGYYKDVLQSYYPDLRILIKKTKDNENRIGYTLVDEDEDTKEWSSLSPRPMTKTELLVSLVTECSLQERRHRILWRRHLKAEQQRERQLWEENSIE